jgi:hypothetical protein
MTLRLSSLGVAVGALVLAQVACQTYDFEPVEPLAIAQVTERKTIISKAPKANIMLVVDQSGSMLEPINPSGTNCNNCGFNKTPCPGSCPTRISEMKSAMGDFLVQFGTTARYGLNVFPPSDPGEKSENVCGAGKVWLDVSGSNDVDGELQAHSNNIRTLIQGILPTGGTPIGPTLQGLANHDALNQDDDRSDFVLLLTDGLPNCNPGLNAATCTCAAVDQATGQPYSPCNSALNCLDQDRVVQTIQALQQKKIKTIVVAFGADVGNALALGPLNAMAEAGGFARRCSTADDCGGGETCDGATGTTKDGFCSVKFYKAANALELTKALDEIRKGIPKGDPCEFVINATPQSEKFVVVYVDGEKLAAGADTWNLKQEGDVAKVTMTGSLCTKILNATPASPVDVEIRIVEGL